MSSFDWEINSIPSKLRGVWVESAIKHARWLTFVAFYAVFANLPYWLAAHQLGFIHRGWFSLEFAIAGLLALTVPRLLAAALFVTFMLADLLYGICATYLLPTRELLANLSTMRSLTTPRLVWAATAFLLSLLTASISALMPGNTLPENQRRRAGACLVLFAAVLGSIHCILVRHATGQFPVLGRFSSARDGTKSRTSDVPRLARMSIIWLISGETYQARINRVKEIGPASAFPMLSATDLAIRSAHISSRGSSGELPNFVLVLVESWGLANEAPLNQALLQPYLQPNVSTKYELIQGSVPFHGPTIAGEARELCSSGIGFHLLTAAASDLQGCLPTRLAALGYNTIGVHGMNGHTFNRSEWYRTIGFQERWFQEQFERQQLADCGGAFIGTCDADIAAWIGRRLEEDNPIFIHWMTLNSHLPVPVPTSLLNAAPCSTTLGLNLDSPLCSWFQLVANVHQSVAQLASGRLGRPTVFVIVGDHAPPFADIELRDRFSQAEVPFVVLVPRSLRVNSKTMIAHDAGYSAIGTSAPVRRSQ